MQILLEELVAGDAKLKSVHEKGQHLITSRHPASNTIQVSIQLTRDVIL